MSYTIQFETRKKEPLDVLGSEIPVGTTFAFGKGEGDSIIHKTSRGQYLWLSMSGNPNKPASPNGFEPSSYCNDTSIFTNYRPVQLSLVVKEL